MDETLLAKIPEKQRECLRLVLRHMSSKEIARVLGVSSHTVDQRLKLAMRTLNASTRVEAARLLASLEELDHQSLVHQPPYIAAGSGSPASVPSIREEQRSLRSPLVVRGNHAGPDDASSSTLEEGRQHARIKSIVWIVAVAAGLAVFFAAVFVGLNALSDFTR